jgi:hypothetical protein
MTSFAQISKSELCFSRPDTGPLRASMALAAMLCRAWRGDIGSRSSATGRSDAAGLKEESEMKRIGWLFVFVLCVAAILPAENSWSFKGTVVKMKMADCIAQTGFRASMSGAAAVAASCPEYTVLGEKVVYVVVGRRTVEFIPLAEDMDFLVRKNEIVIFSQDEKSKSRFVIQQMTLRADWEREEKRKELVEKALERSVNYEVRNPPRVAAVSASAQ